MLSDYLIAPSLNSLFVTGLLLLMILIIVVRNFNDVKKFTTFQKISILCILTIAIGSHGLIHLGVEKQYGFNPYKWF
jgi:hypothetical protein